MEVGWLGYKQFATLLQNLANPPKSPWPRSTKKQDEEQALKTKNKDLEGTQEELDAWLDYFNKLKPSCVDSGVRYEDRVARISTQ